MTREARETTYLPERFKALVVDCSVEDGPDTFKLLFIHGERKDQNPAGCAAVDGLIVVPSFRCRVLSCKSPVQEDVE